MVTFDRRDEFEDSDSLLDTVAAEAHDLYASEAFREDVIEALGPVFKQHLDCEAVDAAAEEVLREWFYKDGKGGLYQMRNQIVTNREADLDEGDIIRMRSAREGDDRIIRHVVHAGDPAETGVKTLRVDPEDGTRSYRDINAGQVKYADGFDVERAERGRNPHTVARELGEEIAGEVDDD